MTGTPDAQTPLPPQPGLQGKPLLRQGALVFLLAMLLGVFLQLNPGFEETADGTRWTWQRFDGLLVPGDGPYHVKIAYLYRTGEVFKSGKDFHWTRESLWNGGFTDKDFLYHMMLVPFTLGAQDEFDSQALVNGAKFSSTFFFGLLALSFWFAAHSIGLKRPWLWTLFALAVCGSSFLGRTLETRSWMPGVSCALLGWAALTRGSRRWVFVVGALYALAYTGCHLLVAMAGFRLVVGLVFGPPPGQTRRTALRSDLILLACAAGGIALGALLHPNTLQLPRLWWVQNVLVLHLYQGGTMDGWLGTATGWIMGWEPGQAMPVIPQDVFGNELRSMKGVEILNHQTYLVVLPFAVPLLAALARLRVKREHVIQLGLGMVFAFLNFRVLRFTEYALPFLALAAAYWLQGALATRKAVALLGKVRVLALPRSRLVVALCLLVLGSAVHVRRVYIGFAGLPFLNFTDVGDWLQANDEVRGKVIYNHNWDAFPELFFYRADCDYMAGLDPVYTAVTATDNAHVYIKIMAGRVDEVAANGPSLVRRLREDFGADYIFAHHVPDPAFLKGLKQMADAGLLEPIIVHEGYALYRIPPPRN